jgi:hypothetical protein
MNYISKKTISLHSYLEKVYNDIIFVTIYLFIIDQNNG